MPTTTAASVLRRLDENGRRRTSARAKVVAATLGRSEPFSAEQLVQMLARKGVGRATVFRTLELLVSIGALARVHGTERGGRCVRYTPCAPAHHHHVVCRSCGRVEEVELAGLDTRLAAVARARGYASLGHTIEIAGICADCRAARR